MNIMNMGMDFNAADPMGSMNKGKQNFDKCCLEHDACQQTCGMSSGECHNVFNKCAQKKCKGNENCMFQAQIGQMMSGPSFADDGAKHDEKEGSYACRAYDTWQKDSCECEDDDKWEGSNDKRLKTFYKLYNPDKLDAEGEIKDLGEVKKKWKGKESEMFLALTTKYKDKTIERKIKPKPPPYTPPVKKDGEEDSSSGSSDSGSGSSDFEDITEEVHKDPEDQESRGEKKIARLKTEKLEAVEKEEFDKAGDIKEQLAKLIPLELDRLKKAKEKAVEDEEFLKAKSLKARIEKLEL